MTAIPCAVCDLYVPLVDGVCVICAQMQRDLEASGHKATFIKLDAKPCAVDWDRAHAAATAALKTWGAYAQTDKACEECAEFIAAVSHYKGGKITLEQLAEEAVGVMLTNAQVFAMLPPEVLACAFARQVTKLEAAIAKARG